MFKYTKDLIGNEYSQETDLIGNERSQETDLIGNERSQETNMWKESGLDGVENNMCAKKIVVAEELAEKINKVSRCQRTGKSVLSKITHVEKAWRQAHDWVNATGQGV